MKLRRRLREAISRADKLDAAITAASPRLAAVEAEVKDLRNSRSSNSSFWLSVTSVGLSTVLVAVQCVLLFRQTEIMGSQERLTVLQQQQGTDSYDFSAAGAITVRRPDAQTVVLENRSPNGVFDSFVQLQGVGGFNGAPVDGAAFSHVLQRIDILASCERVTLRMPSVFRNNEFGESLYLNGVRTTSESELTEFSSGSATLVFEGAEHWWAVGEHGGIFRLDAVVPRESSVPSDELLLLLDSSLPEDSVLGDTVLEGVDLEGLTAISAPRGRDSDLVRYDDFQYEIARSEREPTVQRESISGCSYL